MCILRSLWEVKGPLMTFDKMPGHDQSGTLFVRAIESGSMVPLKKGVDEVKELSP